MTAPPPSTPRLGHIPALDALRGIAILLVLATNLYPLGLPVGLADSVVRRLFRAGWVGVDLFFVLSGFLITSILLDTKGSSRYLITFWGRRVLRIFPLYYGTLAVLFVVLPLLPLADRLSGLQTFREVQGWYWSYLTNVLIARRGWGAAPYGTDHFWSLAVEEQYYLVWPLVVLWCDSRQLRVVCLTLIAGALGLRIAAHFGGVSPAAIYVCTFTRMDSLAAGSLLAVLSRDSHGSALLTWWARRGGWIAGLGLGVIVVWYGQLSTYDVGVQTLGHTVLAGVAAALVALAIIGAAPGLDRGRSGAVLQWFGRYSYAIYVVHQFVLLGLQRIFPIAIHPPPVWGYLWPGRVLVVLAGTAVSAGVALLSWHLYERPFLRLKHRIPYTMAAPPASS